MSGVRPHQLNRYGFIVTKAINQFYEEQAW
jgi:hypothetical protein